MKTKNGRELIDPSREKSESVLYVFNILNFHDRNCKLDSFLLMKQ